MGYRIDPDRDRRYIEEFRLNPVGHHSPGLLRVLNRLRYDPSGRKLVLLCRRPFAEWVLATLPPDRADPIEIDDSRVFTSREEAEWAVFCRRWQAHTGEILNQPYRESEAC